MRIKQQWIPYWEWEDWHAGMWTKGDESRLQEAIDFTADHIRYGDAMLCVVVAWPRTMINALTNPSINQRAFVGHCAVSYTLGITEDITRAAWKHLTGQQRNDANDRATEAIQLWKNEYLNT